MLNEIGAAISALSGIRTIADGLRAERDESKLLTARIELLGHIADVQQVLLTNQQTMAALIQENERLVAENKQAKQVEAELHGYELAEIAVGAFVLARQPDAQGLRRAPYFCPTCRSDGKKSVLSFQGGTAVLHSYLVCPRDEGHRIALPAGRFAAEYLGRPLAPDV